MGYAGLTPRLVDALLGHGGARVQRAQECEDLASVHASWWSQVCTTGRSAACEICRRIKVRTPLTPWFTMAAGFEGEEYITTLHPLQIKHLTT
jgi:hypothetical protein